MFPVSSCILFCSVKICLHCVLFCYIVSERNFVLLYFLSVTCFCDVLSCEIFLSDILSMWQFDYLMFCLVGNLLVKFCHCCVMSGGILSKWHFFQCHFCSVMTFFPFFKSMLNFSKARQIFFKNTQTFWNILINLRKYSKRENIQFKQKEATENLAWNRKSILRSEERIKVRKNVDWRQSSVKSTSWVLNIPEQNGRRWEKCTARWEYFHTPTWKPFQRSNVIVPSCTYLMPVWTLFHILMLLSFSWKAGRWFVDYVRLNTVYSTRYKRNWKIFSIYFFG